MQDDNREAMRRGKGRPPAPFKEERLAITTHLVNQGMTFKAAAEAGVVFYEYDFKTRTYIRDVETDAKLPGTPAGRRTALYESRRDLLAPWLSPSGPPNFNGRPLPIPVALRFEEPPERGRPKKKRLR